MVVGGGRVGLGGAAKGAFKILPLTSTPLTFEANTRFISLPHM